MMLITIIAGITALTVATLMTTLQGQRIRCEQAADELADLWREAAVVRSELQTRREPQVQEKSVLVSKIIPASVPKSGDRLM